MIEARHQPRTTFHTLEDDFAELQIVSSIQNGIPVRESEMNEGIIYTYGGRFKLAVNLGRVKLIITVVGQNTGEFSLDVASATGSIYPIINMSPEEKRKFEKKFVDMVLSIRNLPTYSNHAFTISSNSAGHIYNLEGVYSGNIKSDKAYQRSLYRERQLRRLFPKASFDRKNLHSFTMTLAA